MIQTILGTKLNMTQVFDKNGKRLVATQIQAGPCTVSQVKTIDKDGYQAVQVAFGNLKRVNKPISGHLKKAGISDSVRYLQEIKVPENSQVEAGTKFTISDIFEPGDIVNITGFTKGKGFAGVIKRWGFSGYPASHGHDGKRFTGSVGAGTTPGRVYKGKKMPGRMGNDKLTIEGLTVLSIDILNNTLLVSGPIPGATTGLLAVTKIGKNDSFPGINVAVSDKMPNHENENQKNNTIEEKTESDKSNIETEGSQNNELPQEK